MNKTKHIIILGISFIIIILILVLLSFIIPNYAWGIIETITTILGVFLVVIELRESKNLSEGNFVASLSDSFNSNEGIQRIYKKLELGEVITDEDTVDIVAFLTYYETIYVLLKKGAINIALIDDLFAYRFNLALSNDAIRRISLVRYGYAYANIYNLEFRWCKYKKKKSILEQHNPNYIIILGGNKMKEDDILFRVAENTDASAIHNLMEEVYDRLEDKSLYVCDDFEYVKEHIKEHGFTVVACNKNDEIIGSFIFRYPHQDEDNLGKDINLSKENLDKVVHMESSVVLPKYRGNGLQSKMLQYAEELIDKNKYHYFIATVSPNNPASYKSFEKNGYTLITTKEKYDGLIRRIYLKEV